MDELLLKIAVKNAVSESIKEEKIKKIDERKNELRKQAHELVALQKQKFGKMDISSPMSNEEKELTKKIAGLYSEINQLIIEKKSL